MDMTNCLSCKKIIRESSSYSMFENDNLMQKCLIYKIFQITGVHAILQQEDLTFLCLNCRTLLFQIHTLERKLAKHFKIETVKEPNKVEADESLDNLNIDVAYFDLDNFEAVNEIDQIVVKPDIGIKDSLEIDESDLNTTGNEAALHSEDFFDKVWIGAKESFKFVNQDRGHPQTMWFSN